MNKISFIALYIGRKCLITLGPHTGKYIVPTEFHFTENLIGSKSGTMLPVENVKLVLRKLEHMNDNEGYFIYRLYNEGQATASDWTGDNGSANWRPKQITANRTHALRLIQGLDYTAPDFDLWMACVPYLLQQGFNIFGERYKDYFVYE